MNTKPVALDMKAKLSTLWIFVLLNMTFRDIHEFLKPGFIQEVMTGTLNGTQLTEGLFLLGGFMVEVPIAMVLLSRFLNYGLNRWANIIAGATTIAFIIANGATDMDDTFFVIIELAALSFLIWQAWKWSGPKLSLNNKIQQP